MKKKTRRPLGKITWTGFWGHLKTVLTHKWFVFRYSCYLGIPVRGLIHDLSKFHPVEFWEGVRYWTGTASPIAVCKGLTGQSRAWLHHKGRNRHHYEYWIDYLDDGGVPQIMPFKYVVELLADYLAAGRTYNGKSFTLEGEYKWWQRKLEYDNPKMHPVTREFVGWVLKDFAELPLALESFWAHKKEYKRRYELIVKNYYDSKGSE